MTHHTNLVQTGLAVEQNKAGLEVSIKVSGQQSETHSPSLRRLSNIHQYRALIIPQIDTFTSVPYDISSTRDI